MRAAFKSIDNLMDGGRAGQEHNWIPQQISKIKIWLSRTVPQLNLTTHFNSDFWQSQEVKNWPLLKRELGRTWQKLGRTLASESRSVRSLRSQMQKKTKDCFPTNGQCPSLRSKSTDFLRLITGRTRKRQEDGKVKVEEDEEEGSEMGEEVEWHGFKSFTPCFWRNLFRKLCPFLKRRGWRVVRKSIKEARGGGWRRQKRKKGEGKKRRRKGRRQLSVCFVTISDLKILRSFITDSLCRP